MTPSSCDPAEVYVVRLGTEHSRATARSALRTVSRALDVEHIDWPSLTYADLAHVRASLGRLSVGWANSVWSVTRQVMIEGRRLGVIDSGVVDDVLALPRLRGGTGRLGRNIDGEEIAALLAVLDLKTPTGCRDGALLALLVDGALRRSETVSVATDDWSSSRRLLTVAQGKGRKSRVVPFPEWSADLIDRWIDVHPGGGMLLRSIDRWGRVADSMSSSTVPMILERLCDRAGIQPVSAHAFRAHRLTEVITCGGLGLARVLAGHSSTSTTSIYDRRGLSELEEVVSHLDQSTQDFSHVWLDRCGLLGLPQWNRRRW